MLGVSPDTVRRMADAGKLKIRRTRGGHRLVSGDQLARAMKSDPGAPSGLGLPLQSTRNRFPGIVTKVIKDRVAAQVEIQAGPFRFVALVTREAVEELALAPGSHVAASVKATHVAIEKIG